MSKLPVPASPIKMVLRIALVVVLVAAAITGFFVVRDQLGRCDGLDSVREIDGECVGVSAAETNFGRTELDDVIGKIKEANADAVDDPNHVSVALFLPMSPVEDGSVPIEWVRHHLQGVYQAQVDFNRSARPRVRLLLANPGRAMDHWERVVDELDRRRAAPDHLVAVTGIGMSLDKARKAMQRMSELRIPMVGSTITADDLDQIGGLLRPAPTNARQAQAAAAYARNLPANKALLITDTNETDLYPKTLATAFRTAFTGGPHEVLEQVQEYDSGLDGVDNAFALMLPNICATQADVVYFAGRGRHLAQFIEKLGSRLCQDKPITILTGDDLSSVRFRADAVRVTLESNVTVTYTDLAHPGAWEADRVKPVGERKFVDAAIGRFIDVGQSTVCFRCVFGNESLDDGAAIMAHDAMLTVTTAIQKTSGGGGDRVTPPRLLQTFNALNGVNAVVGSSGTLSYDNKGTVQKKIVPLLRLRSDGSSVFVKLEAS